MADIRQQVKLTREGDRKGIPGIWTTYAWFPPKEAKKGTVNYLGHRWKVSGRGAIRDTQKDDLSKMKKIKGG